MTLIPVAGPDAGGAGSRRGAGGEIVHLPVAPHVAARTRFSSSVPRRVNFLMPQEAIALLDAVMAERGDRVSMAAITGPGDPLAVPDTTLKTIELVRRRWPGLQIGLRTLGIGGERFAGELARAGVNYVELEVNAVKAEILEKLYAWIRPGLKTLKIAQAVELLLREQRNCVPALKYDGIGVSITTTLYPGYNLDHIKQIGSVMMELGADSISLVPYEPEAEAEVQLAPPEAAAVEEAGRVAGFYLPVVPPLLGGGWQAPAAEPDTATAPLPKPTPERPNVAVVSSNGIEVDLHLGHAVRLLIYGPRQDGLACLLETRNAPEPGGGEQRWLDLARILGDCFVVLTASAGTTPRRLLSEQGISVIVTEENIEGCVDVLYGGGKKKGKGR